MAHFAKIENGRVTEVVVVDNAHEQNGDDYLNSIGLAGRWVQTSYSAAFGKKFAAVGDSYAETTGNFKPAQPFPSWTFSNSEWTWKPPKPAPQGGNAHLWNEELLDWVEVI
jgi:hypothetical protein